jgi:hypothetical protein
MGSIQTLMYPPAHALSTHHVDGSLTCIQQTPRMDQEANTIANHIRNHWFSNPGRASQSTNVSCQADAASPATGKPRTSTSPHQLYGLVRFTSRGQRPHHLPRGCPAVLNNHSKTLAQRQTGSRGPVHFFLQEYPKNC